MQRSNRQNYDAESFGMVAPSAEAMRAVMQQVYLWMAGALFITAGTAVITVESGLADSLIRNPLTLIGAIVVQLGLVFWLSARVMKMSAETASIMFFLYAALNGLTLSLILLAYTAGSVAGAFVSTSAMFGAMSIYGLTTKADLSKIHNILFMALIGLIVAMIVNIFMASSALNFVISLAGVVIFTGLTAADTQKISRMAGAVGVEGDKTNITRVAILGALILYLDFINLFIFILRLVGDRR